MGLAQARNPEHGLKRLKFSSWRSQVRRADVGLGLVRRGWARVMGMTLKGPHIFPARPGGVRIGWAWQGEARGHEQARKRLKLSLGDAWLGWAGIGEASRGKDTIFYLKHAL